VNAIYRETAGVDNDHIVAVGDRVLEPSLKSFDL